MTETVTNELILEHLKALRADSVQAKRDRKDIVRRLGNIESSLSTLRRDQALASAEQVEDRHAMDDLKCRVERIERRLELTD